MTRILQALRLYLALTLLTGIIYPLIVTVFGQALFSKEARGSLIEKDGQFVGSKLIAQKFENDRYFWPRPSAIDFNPLPSGGSNLGPTSKALKDSYLTRQSKFGNEAPQSLLFASGSGLDPEIEPAAALYQVSRVAKARGLEENVVRDIVVANQQGRQLGLFGEERVNVLQLNLALDESKVK